VGDVGFLFEEEELNFEEGGSAPIWEQVWTSIAKGDFLESNCKSQILNQFLKPNKKEVKICIYLPKSEKDNLVEDIDSGLQH
jgi:hypothetical protein